MSEWKGYEGKLVPGDFVRVTNSCNIEEVGIVSEVKQVIHEGLGRNRKTGKEVNFTTTYHMLEDTGRILYPRHDLYKLPPDFLSVIHKDVFNQIAKLLAHDKGDD